MAIYNLFAGGNDISVCNCGDGLDLPEFAQPDLQNHAGYGFRFSENWKGFMRELNRRYGLTAKDLKVGDKLRIFLSPNHATLKSLSVDFKQPIAGFGFKFQTAQNLDLTAKSIVSEYDESTLETTNEVVGNEMPSTPFGADVKAFSRHTFIFTEFPHTAKVDAVELEITALPAKNMNVDVADIWFTRRFEIDGKHW